MTGAALGVLLALLGDPFGDALALRHAERYAEAAAAFEALAASEPGSPLAPEALWDAARLYAERLAAPEDAGRALRGILERYPASRVAERARAQLEWIAARGPAAKAFLALDSTDAGSMTDFLRRWPDSPDAARVRLRLARLQTPAEAEATLAPLLTDPAWVGRAYRALGTLRFAAGAYAEAVEAYEAAGDAAGGMKATRMLLYQRIAVGAMAAVAIWAFFLLLRGWRAGTLWPPPPAVSFFAPVAAVFVLAAWPMAADFRGALWSMAIGACVLLWIGGAAPPRGPAFVRALLHGLVMFAFVYAVVFHFELFEPIGHTLKYGPE